MKQARRCRSAWQTCARSSRSKRRRKRRGPATAAKSDGDDAALTQDGWRATVEEVASNSIFWSSLSRAEPNRAELAGQGERWVGSDGRTHHAHYSSQFARVFLPWLLRLLVLLPVFCKVLTYHHRLMGPANRYCRDANYLSQETVVRTRVYLRTSTTYIRTGKYVPPREVLVAPLSPARASFVGDEHAQPHNHRDALAHTRYQGVQK